MKTKSLLLLALSAMAMGGCMKSEIDVDSINSTNAISFSTSTDKQTKATALSNSNATNSIFSVFAYSTSTTAWASFDPSDADFMYDQTVSYVASDTNAWTYSPIKYWPDNDGEKVSFFAYMPYDAAATVASLNATTSLPEIVFTQDMDVEEMIDLTVAQALDLSKANSTVTMSFDHILTRMNFAVKTEKAYDSNTKVYVTGIKLLGSTENSNSKLYSTATYEMADGTESNGAWTYDSETAVIEADDLDLEDILVAATDVDNGIEISDSTTALLGKDDGGNQHYLFLIPPTATGVASDSDIQINVDYKIVTTDDTDYTSTATATLSMPEGTLQSEVAYNVVLTIGLNEVLMDVDITDINGNDDSNTTNAEEVVAPSTASTLSDLIALITAAFNSDVDSYSIIYTGEDTALDIDLSSVNNNLDMDLTISLPDVESAISITITDYLGQLTVYAPKATVTLNGTTYYSPVTTTAETTLIIAEGVTVDGLTILAGNVEVNGTLKGDVSVPDNTTIKVGVNGDLTEVKLENGEKVTIDSESITNYYITSGAELKTFATLANTEGGSRTGINGYLLCDIDLSEICNSSDGGTWTPIGNSSTQYAGIFDGNGYKVSNLYINSSEQNQGLFGSISGATIKNLGVVDGSVNTSVGTSPANIGAIVGSATSSSEITNCYNTCNVNISATLQTTGFGGIVGYAEDSTIKGCYNTGSIFTNDTSVSSDLMYVGGIIGRISGTTILQNCYNAGSISAAYSHGGIMGSTDGTAYSISYCYSYGSVGTESVTYSLDRSEFVAAGGVAGGGSTDYMSYCYYDTDTVDDDTYTYHPSVAVNNTTDTDTVKGLSTDDMKDSSILLTNLQTENSDVWAEDTTGINNGYPILKWQVE